MKKVKLLFLIMVVMTTFASCSWFDSDPIEPKIIGTDYLHCDDGNGICYVTIDSINYPVSSVVIPDENPRTVLDSRQLNTVGEMQVTIFKCKKFDGIQAVAGKQSEADIEDLYYENSTLFFVLMGILFICIAVLIFTIPSTRMA